MSVELAGACNQPACVAAAASSSIIDSSFDYNYNYNINYNYNSELQSCRRAMLELPLNDPNLGYAASYPRGTSSSSSAENAAELACAYWPPPAYVAAAAAAASRQVSSGSVTSEGSNEAAGHHAAPATVAVPAASAPRTRQRRKRARTCKNSEEVESQRMTHIAVERNRRRQMNEHLSVLRSLMPASYIQRGDQASIIGGAIEFVKELEHVLHTLQLQKERRETNDSCIYSQQGDALDDMLTSQHIACEEDMNDTPTTNNFSEREKDVFLHDNVEVKMIGTSASVKVLAQKKPHQLFHVLSAMESLQLRVLHLNITVIDQSVLYSLNMKVDDPSKFQSPKDIGNSVESIFELFG